MCQAEATTFAHRLFPQPCTPSSRSPWADRGQTRGSAAKNRGSAIEPALQVLQPADFVRRDIGRDRFQAARRAKPAALGVDDPREVGAVQHVVFMNGCGHHPGSLFRRQPAQGLHEHLEFTLAQFALDLLQAAMLNLAERRPHHFHQFFLAGPTDFKGNGQAIDLGGRRRGIQQDQRPQSRVGREIQIANAVPRPADLCSAG